MKESIIKVEGMSCEHCVKAIKNTLEPLAGIISVAVDLSAKTVTVGYDPAKISTDVINLAIEDQGYDVIAQ